MPAYSGKHQYLDERGGTLSQGPRELKFDEETCVVTPAGGAPLAFDLGDADRLVPAEWDLQVVLYTGRTLQLRQFGAAFGRMSEELLAAWRNRTVQCLLLEDLDEVARYQGAAGGLPSEIRLYRSNLAILPLAGSPLQWRLADIDSIRWDDASYSLTLQSGRDSVTLTKLAKKTDEFRANLSGALDQIRTGSAEALHAIFPFLNPDQLQRTVLAMPEGRSVRLSSLAAIHSKLPDALIARAVDAPLQPYFDALRARAGVGELMAGFKFIRADDPGDGDTEAPPETQPEPSTEGAAPPLFFWFFFPIAGRDLVAWEATTGTGRATYFFKAPEPAENAVQMLTRGLALVNFRREPVYLPDESLDRYPRYHRYAIGCRKLPDLRALRSAYAGRAIHSALETWTAQVKGIAG